MYKTEKRLYVTADRSRVVDEDDPAAAVLLAAEGVEIQDDEAARLGLTGKRHAAAEPEVVYSTVAPPKEADAPSEEDDDDEKVKAKALGGPPENKARHMASKKDDK